METVGITGGTGFVGQHLIKLLTEKGYKVIIFTTGSLKKSSQAQVAYASWDPLSGTIDKDALKGLDAMVHLAGAGIADKRWKPKRKLEITNSRVKGTEFIVAQLKAHAKNCVTFIAASATGFYGPDNGRKPFTEEATPYNDFLGNTCKLWEEASARAASFARTTILRFGIVLGKESGALPQFLQPLSMGVMPILGSGGQIMSWIELDDLARMIVFALEHKNIRGIYNAVAPHACSHWQLMHTLAKVKGGMKIPFHVPSALLKILLGEMSVEVLKSCTVSPNKILDAGFYFVHPELEGAIKSILNIN